ncbi:zinc-dependent metalloprotease [Paraliomyxa miuraensis]|nr:M57 family metalloprotease [Paraliomyxa miuraensis]MCX4242072.1 zinc-dependent metalloprotease [Paraliomyxa miuraensis]
MRNKRIDSGIVMVSCMVGALAGCVAPDDDELVVDERNAEIVENLLEAGFSEQDIEVRESEMIDPELGPVVQARVFVDGDTHITLEASRELLGEPEEGESFRHWRTPNLLDDNEATICLAKVTTAAAAYSSYVLTADMEVGVNRAKTNFNNTLSALDFKVGEASIGANGGLSHSISGCTYSIFVYKVNGGAGGSAGFPSGGSPYSQVRLNSGLAGYDLDVHEHVATHEVGHAIGFRHTDWKTRSSCGQNTNEGQTARSRSRARPTRRPTRSWPRASARAPVVSSAATTWRR